MLSIAMKNVYKAALAVSAISGAHQTTIIRPVEVQYAGVNIAGFDFGCPTNVCKRSAKLSYGQLQSRLPLELTWKISIPCRLTGIIQPLLSNQVKYSSTVDHKSLSIGIEIPFSM